jgi:MFS family permease
MAMSLSTEAYEAYIRKNETWNFVANTMDLVFYNLAGSFIFGSTVLTLYASHLTDSAILIGLIPAIQSIGYFLPQLLMARQTEQLARKKPLVMKISVVERLPYLFVTLGILLWPGAPTWLSFTILALSLAIATFAGGLASPAWQGMLAKVIPARRRGVFFGLSQALGGMLGIGGAAISRHVLDAYAYPLSFGLCFLFCFIGQALSWASLSFNREPAKEPGKEAVSSADYWRRLPRVLRDNLNFARYLGSRALIILGSMGTYFYIVYARHAFQVTDAFAATLTIVALISQTVCTPVLGWLADRYGYKWLTELSTLFGLGVIILVLVAPSAAWFYAVFALANASSSGMMVAGLSMTMEFSSPEDLPTFAALANTLLAIPILLSPVIGGWLIDSLGYQVLFVAALVFLGLGWGAMHWGVREPRHERQRLEALAAAEEAVCPEK